MIRVHVERLVLEGLPIGGADRERLATALIAGLSARLQDRGPSRGPWVAGAQDRVDVPSIRSSLQNDPVLWGAEIGRAVHAGIVAEGGATRSMTGEARS